ncbi:hypothetical protein F511_25394 [Dorcoceras hygrometricum]|uniref:Uncharacterized protein n=1 Tax=Dorcoceras hygrometricum TaxID=472368 RepID=A0A2Z7AF11_9LAMI|nr:hypothetical protein F511_25394 [Dorcoceras hygrometricum]
MLTWISVVGVLARIQLLRVISCWYVSYDDQQRALRDSEATTFCEHDPAVGFVSVFCSGCWFVDQLLVRSAVAMATVLSVKSVLASVSQVIPLAVALTQMEVPKECLRRCRLDVGVELLSVLGFDPEVPLGLLCCLPICGSGFPGYSAGRGFDPAGGAPGGR